MARGWVWLVVVAGACAGSDEPLEPHALWGGPDEWEPITCAWEDRVDDPEVDDGSVSDVALASDGGLVAAGSISRSDDVEYWLRRYSAAGEVAWTTESEPGGYHRYIQALALDAQDRIGVAGDIGRPDGFFNLWAAGFSATGDEVWSLDPALLGSNEDACLSPGGDLYVTGNIITPEHPSTGSLLWLGKFAIDGTLAWSTMEAGDRSRRNEGMMVVCEPSGGVVVVGDLAKPDGYSETWVRRYDADGDPLWTTTLGDPQGTSPDAALEDGDEILVAVQLADRKRLYRLAVADGAITADLPAPERRILAADDGGTYVDGHFFFDIDPGCRNAGQDPCSLVPYWGYAYFDWNAEQVWWRADTTGIPNDETRNAVTTVAVGDGVRVAAGTLQNDIWLCRE